MSHYFNVVHFYSTILNIYIYTHLWLKRTLLPQSLLGKAAKQTLKITCPRIFSMNSLSNPQKIQKRKIKDNSSLLTQPKNSVILEKWVYFDLE